MCAVAASVLLLVVALAAAVLAGLLVAREMSVLVASVAVLFMLVTGGIEDLDSPFSWPASIGPDRMRDTIARIDTGTPTAPCDEDGVPL